MEENKFVILKCGRCKHQWITKYQKYKRYYLCPRCKANKKLSFYNPKILDLKTLK